MTAKRLTLSTANCSAVRAMSRKRGLSA
jgi:hypothetical protein